MDGATVGDGAVEKVPCVAVVRGAPADSQGRVRTGVGQAAGLCGVGPVFGGAVVGSLQEGEVFGGAAAPFDQEEGRVVGGAAAPLLFEGVGE